MKMKKKIIDCREITKTYITGDIETKVLKGLSFSINEGEFVAIIGPSGSGKSTLMHILGGLDTPTTGEYLLDGMDVSKLSDDELANIRSEKIGFVFQSFSLLARATVVKNVELPLVYAGKDPEKRWGLIDRALEAANMEKGRYYNKSNQLSGGQMQRVAIARALVNNPAIILADEPTGNLDQKTGHSVLDTFQKLNNDGRTVILITHDPYVADHAERIIQIKDGEIVDDSINSRKTKRILEGREE
jgi:putative ABC transport system ATP-binding protein